MRVVLLVVMICLSSVSHSADQTEGREVYDLFVKDRDRVYVGIAQDIRSSADDLRSMRKKIEQE